MVTIWVIVSIILVLLFFYILFAGVEYSFLASNPLTLELKRDQKLKRNSSLGMLLDNPDIFWRTTSSVSSLIMILVTLLLYTIHQRLLRFDFIPATFRHYFAQYPYMLLILTGIVALLLTYLCKRLIARSIFEYRPENKVNGLSRLVFGFSKVFNPLMLFFKKTSEMILVYLFNARINKDAPIFTGINPYNFFRQSIQGHNVLEKLNKKLFRGAIDLTQIAVRNCITPRTEILAISKNASIDELKSKFLTSKMSKVVVYDKHLDHIIGYVHHLDMNTNPKSIDEVLLPLPAVPETMSALELVRIFTKDRKSIALVVDEFGGTSGLVSMDDILEEIFGNIKDEYDSEELVEKQLSDNEYVFSGRLKIDYLNGKYGFNIPKSDSETLSGFIISRHESIPVQKQKIIIGKFEFEILLVTATKIESVRMKILSH
ncbi:MAG: hemolysin family protein [Taibaiella sp.]|nr:hemolysin family protein [Taibaiella sp.]